MILRVNEFQPWLSNRQRIFEHTTSKESKSLWGIFSPRKSYLLLLYISRLLRGVAVRYIIKLVALYNARRRESFSKVKERVERFCIRVCDASLGFIFREQNYRRDELHFWFLGERTFSLAFSSSRISWFTVCYNSLGNRNIIRFITRLSFPGVWCRNYAIDIVKDFIVLTSCLIRAY